MLVDSSHWSEASLDAETEAFGCYFNSFKDSEAILSISPRTTGELEVLCSFAECSIKHYISKEDYEKIFLFTRLAKQVLETYYETYPKTIQHYFKDIPETIQQAIGYQKEVRSDGNEE